MRPETWLWADLGVILTGSECQLPQYGRDGQACPSPSPCVRLSGGRGAVAEAQPVLWSFVIFLFSSQR